MEPAPTLATPEPASDSPAPPPDWPLWFPLAALACGLAAGLVAAGVVQGVLHSAGVSAKANSPTMNIITTALIDLAVVAACVAIAAMNSRPRPWQFGLRRAPLGLVLAAALAGIVVFVGWEALFQGVFHPKNPQKVVQDIGADLSTAALIAGAIVVVAVAPVCEELFFRGFLYRTLRLRMGMWAAAVVDGVAFGLVHGYLVIVPVLAVFGLILCVVYEVTGTLFATVAIHSANNLVAYGTTARNGWPPALAVGGTVIVSCLLLALLLRSSPGALPRRTPTVVRGSFQ